MSGGLLGSFLSDGGIGKGAVSVRQTWCYRPRSSEIDPQCATGAGAGSDIPFVG